jgi:hypothetical protein
MDGGSQTDRLYSLLSDGEPHRTDEIMAIVYGADHLGLARVGARVYDVQQKYGVKINGWHDKNNPSLYWYQIDRGDNTQAIRELYERSIKSFRPVIGNDKHMKIVALRRRLGESESDHDRNEYRKMILELL